ncbi:ankyrin repeat domain-containing protein [Candidatus Babeliales bacterium]|nr:ankyrin repeat domain-containing protein [Candidatus Babeliales bacterium]
MKRNSCYWLVFLLVFQTIFSVGRADTGFLSEHHWDFEGLSLLNQELALSEDEEEESFLLHRLACEGTLQDIEAFFNERNLDEQECFAVVNQADDGGRGMTSLHWACLMGKADIVDFLCVFGADVSMINGFGYSPAYYAIVARSLASLQALFKYGAGIDFCYQWPEVQERELDVFWEEEDDFTLLHFATRSNGAAMLKFLIEQGCDVHAASKQGATPLQVAIKHGNLRAVKFLVQQSNVLVTMPDNNGLTPLCHALEYKSSDRFKKRYTARYLEIIRILLCAGADLELMVPGKNVSLLAYGLNHENPAVRAIFQSFVQEKRA